VKAMLHIVNFTQSKVNVFNIGSSDSIDVAEIADIIVRQMGLLGVQFNYTGGIDGRGWKGDVKLMQLSIGKIKELGWIPQLGSAGAIKVAVESLLKDECN
jgi:UDP-glucose 4-epimerase